MLTSSDKRSLSSIKKKKYTIAVIGSHSALDVCRGAKDEGFNTIVICEKGKDKTYSQYYKSSPSTGRSGQTSFGCVDEVIVLDKFADILKPEIQNQLIKRNSIFVPHRSFEVYVKDYDAIENDFKVPMFGNKFLLRFEERNENPNQYDILDKAKIRYPKQFKDPKEIDRLCIVKVLEKERGFERAFFMVENYAEYKKLVAKKLKEGIFTEEQLKSSVIEEFIVGVQVNFNFFYSAVHKRLELLGTDTRRQTNIEGLTKTPAPYQAAVMQKVAIKYEEAGHIAVTVLESMLELAFDIGQRFVDAAAEMKSPGVVGPFGLQSMIVAGPPKKDIIVFDVSPRMPGSPGTFSTPYSGYLLGQNMSVGRRVAREVKEAIKSGKLNSVLS